MSNFLVLDQVRIIRRWRNPTLPESGHPVLEAAGGR